MTGDYRLAAPTAVAWMVLAVLIAVPQALPWSAVALWLCAMTLVAAAGRWALRRALLLPIALSAIVAALLLTSAAVGMEHRRPEALVTAAKAGLLVSATAVTTQAVENEHHFAATLSSAEIGGEGFDVTIPVVVFGFLQRPAGIGAELRLEGTLAATAPEDDAAFLFFLDSEAEFIHPPPWYLDWANTLRASFRETATALPGDGGALLPGLAIGDTSAVGEALDGAMKASALSHLTAVSGDIVTYRGGYTRCGRQ